MPLSAKAAPECIRPPRAGWRILYLKEAECQIDDARQREGRAIDSPRLSRGFSGQSGARFPMSVLGFCEWLGSTAISVGIRESTLSFPIIESVHVLGLALKGVPVSEVYARLLPWTWAGAVIMVVSGIFTFLNDPARYYQNVFFRIKVAFLIAA